MAITTTPAIPDSPQALRIREIVLDYFKRTGVPNHFGWTGMDPHVKGESLEIAKGWNLGVSDAVLEKYLTVGLVIAITAYRHTPFDVQVAIALYSLCTTMVDDNIMEHEMLRECPMRLFDGRPQLHPILTRLVEALVTMRQHYSTYSSNVITINTMEFINTEMFLRDEGGAEVRGPQATEYVDYVRWNAGIGEAYAAMIWPRAMFPETKTYIQAMPDAIRWICLVNDLMSYYKEAKAGETDNYVSQRMAACGQSSLDTLTDVVNRIVNLGEHIAAVLGDTPEKKAWDVFSGGYTEFHLYTPRYFLKDIVPEYY
ncbi:hypothetical protein EUX98_g1653 [Antrodiella citrinella]|uniref:Terpene synthase n=1 Tax=Antrodiella citrinella TaxID=2447956 RepID=A0A4S4N0X5_9APHY|nr:hypothetical protein EUX98_g1653 [Antrodiella citrinella]